MRIVCIVRIVHMEGQLAYSLHMDDFLNSHVSNLQWLRLNLGWILDYFI